MNRSIYIITICFCFFLSACIDEISLNIDTDRQFIIVQGQVSDRLDMHQVSLAFSPIIGVGNDNILTPISGASVSLSGDDNTTVVFTESTDEPGTYEAFTATIPGVSYSLEVNTPDGSQIRSNPTVAPRSSVDIEALDFEISTIESFNALGNLVSTEFVDVNVSLDLTGTDRPSLRWRLDGEYQYLERGRMLLNPRTCYIKETTDFNNIAIINTEEVAGDVVENRQIYSTLLNQKFNLIYCFHVFQYTLTEEEYDYWNRIEQLVNIDGTLFDPPPGSIVSNLVDISNDASRIQGYFSVVGETSKRLFVDITQKGSFAESECIDGFGGRNNPPRCSDCPSIPGSSLVKPEYWNP